MFDRRLAEFARDFADETRLWRREALPIIAMVVGFRRLVLSRSGG
jgi:hypothetical protein